MHLILYDSTAFDTIEQHIMQYNAAAFDTIQCCCSRYNTMHMHSIQYDAAAFDTIQCSCIRCNAYAFNTFIHSGHFYSAPLNPLLLIGDPDYSTDTVSEFHAEAHRQLQVKDLPKVLTWRLE